LRKRRCPFFTKDDVFYTSSLKPIMHLHLCFFKQ
jgi:hypothetical protein